MPVNIIWFLLGLSVYSDPQLFLEYSTNIFATSLALVESYIREFQECNSEDSY
jgi:hypothetical protein